MWELYQDSDIGDGFRSEAVTLTAGKKNTRGDIETTTPKGGLAGQTKREKESRKRKGKKTDVFAGAMPSQVIYLSIYISINRVVKKKEN